MNNLPNFIPKNIQSVINDFIAEVSKIFGDRIKKIYLYGSYARGDFRDDSDIDIMILTDFSNEEIIENRRIIADIAYDIEEKYDFNVWISPVVKNLKHFEKNIEYSFFYENVEKDGVVI